MVGYIFCYSYNSRLSLFLFLSVSWQIRDIQQLNLRTGMTILFKTLIKPEVTKKTRLKKKHFNEQNKIIRDLFLELNSFLKLPQINCSRNYSNSTSRGRSRIFSVGSEGRRLEDGRIFRKKSLKFFSELS